MSGSYGSDSDDSSDDNTATPRDGMDGQESPPGVKTLEGVKEKNSQSHMKDDMNRPQTESALSQKGRKGADRVTFMGLVHFLCIISCLHSMVLLGCIASFLFVLVALCHQHQTRGNELGLIILKES